MIKMTRIYYDSDGNQHVDKYPGFDDPDIPISQTALLFMAENYGDVDMDGVNHVVYDRDAHKIIQASGYTMDRGMFCDTY